METIVLVLGILILGWLIALTYYTRHNHKLLKEMHKLHKYINFLDDANVTIYTEYQKALNKYKEKLDEKTKPHIDEWPTTENPQDKP